MKTAENLTDLLADQGVRPKHLKPGVTQKMRCPKCDGGRTREDSLSLTVDGDSDGAVAKCHRGSCGWTWGSKVRSGNDRHDYRASEPKQFQPPAQHNPVEISRPDALYLFFEGRGISSATADWFGCYTIKRRFKDPVGTTETIVFPYKFKGEIVNRKYRPIAHKVMGQDPNALPTLFNVDAIEAQDVVIWVEGEIDVMALHEAGYPQCVTLKDGAPAELKPENDPSRETDKRFAALTTHADFLGGVEKFILAGDMDAPGLVLREELARRLGRHRCWTVEWPDGCKDACDVLRQHGAETVKQCVEAATPYPIEGVQEVTGSKLDDYLERPAPPLLTTGVQSVDDILKLPGEGRVIVITGFPNSGKSTWTMNLMIHLMQHENRRFLVFSPEMQPFEEFAVQCAQILVQKPARRNKDRPMQAVMSREDRVQAGDWLRGRMSFLSTDSEENAPTIDWILEKAKDCVLRLGVTDLLIDPVNELEQARGNMSETEYIGRMLQRVRSFALRHGCNIFIIAHPQKVRPAKHGEKLGPPGPYDISGSAHFANKADLGITIHTPENITQVHLWKARFTRWGRKGTSANMLYDTSTCRYSSPLTHAPMARYAGEDE